MSEGTAEILAYRGRAVARPVGRVAMACVVMVVGAMAGLAGEWFGIFWLVYGGGVRRALIVSVGGLVEAAMIVAATVLLAKTLAQRTAGQGKARGYGRNFLWCAVVNMFCVAVMAVVRIVLALGAIRSETVFENLVTFLGVFQTAHVAALLVLAVGAWGYFRSMSARTGNVWFGRVATAVLLPTAAYLVAFIGFLLLAQGSNVLRNLTSGQMQILFYVLIWSWLGLQIWLLAYWTGMGVLAWRRNPEN